MEKKKAAKRAPRKKALPPRMPQSLSESVLMGALSEVTEADIYRFALAVTAPPSVRRRTSKKQQMAQTHSVLKLATVGYAFWNWRRDAFEPASRQTGEPHDSQ